MTNRDFCLNTFSALFILANCAVEISFMLYGFYALKESYGAFAECCGLWEFLFYNSLSSCLLVCQMAVIAGKLICSGEKHSGNFLQYTCTIYRLITLVGTIIVASVISNGCIDTYKTKYPTLWQATLNYSCYTLGLAVFGILSLGLSCYLNYTCNCCKKNQKESYEAISTEMMRKCSDNSLLVNFSL